MPYRFVKLLSDRIILSVVVVSSWIVELLHSALGLYAELLGNDPLLLFVAFNCWFLDLIAGTAVAISNNKFSRYKAYRTFSKFISYAGTIFITTLISNSVNHLPALPRAAFEWWNEAALIAIIVLDGTSFLRHIHGGEIGLQKFFSPVTILFKGSKIGETTDKLVKVSVEKKEEEGEDVYEITEEEDEEAEGQESTSKKRE